MPSATFQIAATPPRPATPEAVTSRLPSGVKCKAVTLPGNCPIVRSGEAVRDGACRCRGRPGRRVRRRATGRRASRPSRRPAAPSRARGSWGRRAPGGRAPGPCGPRAPDSIQASIKRDLVGSGPRLVLGRHHRLGGAGQDTNDAARPWHRRARSAGPCAVPRCSEA